MPYTRYPKINQRKNGASRLIMTPPEALVGRTVVDVYPIARTQKGEGGTQPNKKHIWPQYQQWNRSPGHFILRLEFGLASQMIQDLLSTELGKAVRAARKKAVEDGATDVSNLFVNRTREEMAKRSRPVGDKGEGKGKGKGKKGKTAGQAERAKRRNVFHSWFPGSVLVQSSIIFGQAMLFFLTSQLPQTYLFTWPAPKLLVVLYSRLEPSPCGRWAAGGFSNCSLERQLYQPSFTHLLACFLSSFLTYFLAYLLTFLLSYFLTFLLSYSLTFLLSYLLSYFLSFFALLYLLYLLYLL